MSARLRSDTESCMQPSVLHRAVYKSTLYGIGYFYGYDNDADRAGRGGTAGPGTAQAGRHHDHRSGRGPAGHHDRERGAEDHRARPAQLDHQRAVDNDELPALLRHGDPAQRLGARPVRRPADLAGFAGRVPGRLDGVRPRVEYRLADRLPRGAGNRLRVVPILGPVVGGLIVANLDWRWIFYVNVPLCAIALLLAWRYMPKQPPAAGPRPRPDITGIALLSPAVAALLYGLASASTHGGFGRPDVQIPVV